MKTRLPTSTVRVEHAYTRADAPWILDGAAEHGDRLAHYLSGGGMKTFGRSVAQEMTRRRHRAFVATLLALAAVWSLFYFL